MSRTSSPYSLSDAIGDLTTDVAGIDTDSLNHSLDALSATIGKIAPQLGPTFDGLSRLSRSLNSRDETLGELIKHAADVTGVLSKHSQKVNSLILSANTLLDVLAQRRQEIVDLLASISTVSRQLSGLVADNEKQLRPALEKLNSVTAMLEKNRDALWQSHTSATQIRLDHTGGSDRHRALRHRLHLQPGARRIPAAIPGLRVRIPAGHQRRTATRQCWTAR